MTPGSSSPAPAPPLGSVADAGAANDGHLAREAATGDREAFAELYRRHAPAVRAAIRDNVADREDQLDVLQESFARALSKLASLQDGNRFRPWLLQIARNAAIDHRRHRRCLTFEGLDDQPQPVPAADPGPDLVTEMRDLAGRVSLGLARLSRRDATTVALAADLGFGPIEIGAALQITPGAAKVALHRARRRLRAALEQETALTDTAAAVVGQPPGRCPADHPRRVL
jgi:RNA polymerase sigma factor (sigma-70 family)